MMSYKDKAFCASSDACASKCLHRFTDASHIAAVKWWGNKNYLVSYTHLQDSDKCVGFTPRLEPTQ